VWVSEQGRAGIRRTGDSADRYGDGVGVVIVTYFPGQSLQHFLDTLCKATSREVGVVVVDNGSTDGAPEHAARRAGVHLVRTAANVGYGAAANRGVAELSRAVGWVVVANADLEWEPDALDELLTTASRWPGGGAFGPQIRDPDGTVYPSARQLPRVCDGIGHALLANVWPGNPWTRYYRQNQSPPRERSAGWLSGSCLLLRRAAFDAAGWFDPRYFMYFEDVDLGDRINRAGWCNVYASSAVVTHLGGHATAREPRRMLLAHHESAYRYVADRHRGLLWVPLLLVIRIGLAVRRRYLARHLRHH